MGEGRSGTPEPTVGADPGPTTVRDRLARARRSGNPDALWPEISRARRVAAGMALGRTVRDVLAGRRTPPLSDDPDAVGVAAFVLGVGPLMGHWIETGAVGASARVSATLAAHLAANRVRVALLGPEIARTARLLAQAGPEPVLLKGWHLSQWYPEPGARQLNDMDFLLPASARPATEQALQAAGWVTMQTDDAGRRVAWRPPGSAAVPRRLDRVSADDPWTLDLHWTLDRRHASGIVRAGDWEQVATSTLDIAGESVTVLDQPDLGFFVAIHASLGFDDLQVGRLIDLILLGRSVPDLWDRAARRADDFDCLHACHPVIELIEEVAPGSVPVNIRDRVRDAAPRRMRRVVAAARPETMLLDDRRSVRQKLMWARGTGSTLATLARLLGTARVATWRRRAHLLGVGRANRARAAADPAQRPDE